MNFTDILKPLPLLQLVPCDYGAMAILSILKLIVMKVMMVVMTMMTLRKLSFLWSAGAEMSHEGWVQNAHKDRLIYQACVVFTIISKDNIYLRT